DYQIYTFLAGPQISFRSERVTPFVHTLFGVAHGRAEGRGSVAGVGQVVQLSLKETAFAAAFGGGVDVKLTDRIWWRTLQADYILTRFDSTDPVFLTSRKDTQNNFRLSTGLVFR
ncbi:MAG TPA: flagellar motor protein MotB, partial [Blastocatellia bacterium]|nr:flagellar motor protein MotB [Blastocatellia bacterium]